MRGAALLCCSGDCEILSGFGTLTLILDFSMYDTFCTRGSDLLQKYKIIIITLGIQKVYNNPKAITLHLVLAGDICIMIQGILFNILRYSIVYSINIAIHSKVIYIII